MLKSALSMLLFSCLLGRLDFTDNKKKTVKCGENITLQCYSSRGAAVIMLKWRKSDLQSELENRDKHLYILFIRENRSYESHQLPSFKGRVQLRDPQMKDGDLSVIIKNVTMNDAGIYECYAGYGKEDPQLMSNITLTVEESGPPGGQSQDGGKKDGGEESGSVGLKVGLSVLAVFVVVVCCITFRKRLNQLISNYWRPADFEMVPVSPAAVPGSQQPVQHSQ